MTGTESEHGLRDEDVAAVLAGQGFGEERPRTGAVLLALLDPLRVAWANAAAVRLFGSDEPGDLSAQVFSGRGREGLGASVHRLVPDGAPRLERLRLIRGFRSRTLAMLVSRAELRDGRPVIVLTTPTPDSPADAADGFAVSGLKRSRATPAAPPPPVEEREPVADQPADVVQDLDAEPASEADLAQAEPDSAEIAATALAAARERLATLRPTRLLWQTDADHHVVRLAGGLVDLAGLDDPAALGRPLADLLRAEPGEDGGLAAALASKASWSALRLRWPLSGLEAGVGVTLGAVPVLDQEGVFAGFKGFGVVDLADLEPLPRKPELSDGPPPEEGPVADAALLPHDAPAADPVAPLIVQEPADEVAAPDDHAPAVGAVAAEPRLDPGPPADPAPIPAPPFPERSYPSSKVVVLRPYQTFAASMLLAQERRDEEASSGPETEAAPSGETRRPETVPPAGSVEAVDLTSSEKSNFNAIARALLGDDEEEDGDIPTAVAPYRAAEGNAANALEALGLAVLVVGPDRFVYANPAFHAVTGYASLDALSEAGGLFHLLGGLEPQVVLGSTEDRAFPLVGGIGGVIGMQGRMRAITWDGGPASLLTMHAVTDRIAQVQTLEGEIKRRDGELAELRAVLDRTSDCLVTVDRQGRVLTMNGAAERLFGYGIAEAAGEPVAMLVGADAQIAVNAGDSAAGLGQAGLDVAGRSASGKTLALRMTWQPLSHGRCCVVLRDLGERSSLQRDLATTKDRLDQALAGKPEFLAKISHEIRTPLNAILGFAEVILDERFGPIGNERYKAYLHDIHDSGAEVLSLINDLLDLSKMEAGRTDMNPAPLDVNRVIGECVGEMQTVAHRERVIVRLSLLPHLAAAHIDERAFRQIMGHILSNAVRFNEPGGQVIVSSAMNEAGAVAVRVRDTGVGMTEAEVAIAMEPFRLSRTANPAGSGLGLPLARALIEANGATMSIRSQKNEGTLVEILLPSAPAERMRVPAE